MVAHTLIQLVIHTFYRGFNFVKVLKARDMGNTYYYAVLLDKTKVDAKGKPDPAFVREFEWGKDKPEGVTKLQYLESIKTETKALCLLALQELSGDGTALDIEGLDL